MTTILKIIIAEILPALMTLGVALCGLLTYNPTVETMPTKRVKKEVRLFINDADMLLSHEFS